MDNIVEKFDPSKLMDGVRDRIKATFVSLIPDDQWQQLCEAEMKKFFEPTYTGYNKDQRMPSQFEELVKTFMRDKLKSYLEETFNKPEYQINQVWKDSGQTIEISEHLDNMIKEKMPEMMQAAISNLMSGAFYNLFSQMRSQIPNVY